MFGLSGSLPSATQSLAVNVFKKAIPEIMLDRAEDLGSPRKPRDGGILFESCCNTRTTPFQDPSG